MLKVTPDFTEEMTPLVPGEFLCRILDAELKVGKEKGTKYISWKLAVLPRGRILYHGTPIHGPGSGLFKHFVHSAGDKEYQQGDYDAHQLINRLVSLDLKVENRIKQDGKEISVYAVNQVHPPTPEQFLSQQDDCPF